MAYGSRQRAVISYVSNTCILPKDGERYGIEMLIEQHRGEMLQVTRFIGSKVRRFFTAIPLLAIVTSIKT